MTLIKLAWAETTSPTAWSGPRHIFSSSSFSKEWWRDGRSKVTGTWDLEKSRGFFLRRSLTGNKSLFPERFAEARIWPGVWNSGDALRGGGKARGVASLRSFVTVSGDGIRVWRAKENRHCCRSSSIIALQKMGRSFPSFLPGGRLSFLSLFLSFLLGVLCVGAKPVKPKPNRTEPFPDSFPH